MNPKFNSFFQKFKEETEHRWENKIYNPNTFGYQIQINTKWLPGHTREEVDVLKELLDIQNSECSEDIYELLLSTKGLDNPQINLNPQSDTLKYKQNWKLNLNYLKENLRTELKELQDSGVIDYLNEIVEESFDLIPIFAHRHIVITSKGYKVYSIYGDDIILYGENLEDYLTREFLN